MIGRWEGRGDRIDRWEMREGKIGRWEGKGDGIDRWERREGKICRWERRGDRNRIAKWDWRIGFVYGKGIFLGGGVGMVMERLGGVVFVDG